MKPEDWMDDAACAEVTPDIFFPEFGNGHTKQALKICAGCPVKDVCLDYAIVNDIAFGLWGAKTPAERRRISRNRRKGK